MGLPAHGPHSTKYYDPKWSGIKSIFSWNSTIWELVLKKREFWFYIWWSLFITSVVIYGVPDSRIEEFNWDAASVMQYVMTFFVTFYNDMCFQRYETLYPEVAKFTDGVLDMTQELIVNMHPDELSLHRIACIKYLLAMVYEHFFMICGGKMRPENWKDMTEKGLLTEPEVMLLQQFPGGRVSTVLTSWVLFIVRDGLIQDCMWRKRVFPGRPEGADVSQQTVHIYNRFVKHVVDMQKCCNRIGYMLANPIPFSYFHLMNFILLFNIMMLATFSALFKSYGSTFPFGVALLIYMGIREVSTALAEPFGEDAVDFCVADMLRNCFDRTLCLLLAFQRQDTREWCQNQIANVEELEERHLRRQCKPKVIADCAENLVKGSPATQCRWTSDSIFENSDVDMDMRRKLVYCLDPKGAPKLAPVLEDRVDEDLKQSALKGQVVAEEERGQALLLELDDHEFDHGRLQLVLEELAFKFPELLDYPLVEEERRVDPKLDGQEVTYTEMVQLLAEKYSDRELTDKMLHRHWKSLLTAKELGAESESFSEGSDKDGSKEGSKDGSKGRQTDPDDVRPQSRLKHDNPLSKTTGREESAESGLFGERTQESLLSSKENTAGTTGSGESGE